MRLRPRHYQALAAARCEPITGVAMGQHADRAKGQFNFSTVRQLHKYGLLWCQPGAPTRYWLTREGSLALREKEARHEHHPG